MSKVLKKLLLSMGGLLLVAQIGAADIYTIDPAHSFIEFTVTHMMVSEAKGSFDDVAGTVEFDKDNIAVTKIDVTIQAKSINTHVEARDKHLRSPDFFDADNYQTITFKSTMLKEQDNGWVVVGDLTLHGVVKRTSFPLKIKGPITTMDGKMVIGLVGNLTVDRQEFGVSWNKQMDNGGYAVGNDVDVSFSVEAKK